jgi:hypothetical protein
LSIGEFLDLAKNYAASLKKARMFPSDAPTYDWLRGFLVRHANLALKKSTILKKQRAQISSEQLDEWLTLMSSVIEENGLVHRPAQIFNADETGERTTVTFAWMSSSCYAAVGMSDAISCSKVIVRLGSSDAYRIQGGSGGKSFTTVMICASATGAILPPFIIYRSKRLFNEWCMGGPPDAGFSNSNKYVYSVRSLSDRRD